MHKFVKECELKHNIILQAYITARLFATNHVVHRVLQEKNYHGYYFSTIREQKLRISLLLLLKIVTKLQIKSRLLASYFVN